MALYRRPFYNDFYMKVGIVGFSGSGKTTIFNALTGLKVQTGHREAGGKPHLGVIKVPDQRVETLAGLLKLKKVTHTEITFMDFAPGEGDRALDPNAIPQMKEADCLGQVVRLYTGPFAPTSPLQEIRDFETDLKVADLVIIEKRLERLKKEKGREQEKGLLERCKSMIEGEKSLRLLSLSEEEKRTLSGFGFLSQKPLLILVNLGEEDIGRPLPADLSDALARERLEAVPLCGKVEMEVTDLAEGDRLEFLKELGLTESARDRFVRSCHHFLQLLSFLTHNQEEVRAWSVRQGTSAVRAAGKIHSDIERGFIRAEVVHYNDFVQCGSEAKSREMGKLRLEGKDYIVLDGDIIRFRFGV